jgi:hypothetical protein
MEIGLYNSIGYLFQAEGLKTTTASKVRRERNYYTTTTYIILKVCVCRWCVCVYHLYYLFKSSYTKTTISLCVIPTTTPYTVYIYRVPSFAPWHV